MKKLDSDSEILALWKLEIVKKKKKYCNVTGMFTANL